MGCLTYNIIPPHLTVSINFERLIVAINQEFTCRKATIKLYLRDHENIYISRNLFYETIRFNEFIFKWATTVLFKLCFRIVLRLPIPFIFIGSALCSSIIWTSLLSLRLCVIDCHRRILEIPSTTLLNKIFVPFIYKWIFEPFKYLVLMDLLWSK